SQAFAAIGDENYPQLRPPGHVREGSRIRRSRDEVLFRRLIATGRGCGLRIPLRIAIHRTLLSLARLFCLGLFSLVDGEQNKYQAPSRESQEEDPEYDKPFLLAAA